MYEIIVILWRDLFETRLRYYKEIMRLSPGWIVDCVQKIRIKVRNKFV